ncbi:MAG: DUF368 domain-containing protein, partial [Deltaproteobacteria bacterium]|nr:DUF368 domain-containing protein [Deltaproteobacteria bacterium]
RMVQKLSVAGIVAGLLGVTLVVGVTIGLSGERRVASARQKVAMKAAKTQARATATGEDTQKKTAAKLPAAKSTTAKKSYTVHVDARNSLVFLGAGTIAISAMILPGISGSFVLLLMGVYFDVLASINERNFVMLGIFSLGCLAGLLLFSRLIKFMLVRFRDVTLTFLTGLVAGSLYAIWPFKSFAFVGDHRVDKSNILPAGFGGNEITTILTVIVGAAIVIAFIWIETKQHKDDRNETEAKA